MDATVRFVFIGVIASLGNCQVFNVTANTTLEVCELESLPLSFSLMCTVDPATGTDWEVTGVSPPLGGAIARGASMGPFTYPDVTGQPILNVNDPSQMDIRNQTCFICRALGLSGVIGRSDPLCINIAGPPAAPSNIMLTLHMATWTPSLSDLSYTVTVCRVDGTNCSSPVTCTGCSSGLIPGIVERVVYNVTVCSFSVVNGVSCMETCASITTAPMPTPTTSMMASSTSSLMSTSGSGNVAAIAGGTVGGLLAVVLVFIIIIVVAVVVIKQKNLKKAGGERLTAQRGEEMVDVHGDTTYAAPGKDKAAAEGGDGVYSYAATTTVVGAQHSKPGGKTKATENVFVQPEKPMRGSKKQPPPADVPHKQGPVGDLYAMPDKKALEVGHKAGPQGDMYAMAAKPSKGGYSAEGP